MPSTMTSCQCQPPVTICDASDVALMSARPIARRSATVSVRRHRDVSPADRPVGAGVLPTVRHVSSGSEADLGARHEPVLERAGQSQSPRNGQSAPGPSRPSSVRERPARSGRSRIRSAPLCAARPFRRSARAQPHADARDRRRPVRAPAGRDREPDRARHQGRAACTNCGSWVATTRACVRGACVWKGKFVLPGGHVELTSAQFSGLWACRDACCTSVAGLYPGGSGLVFPAACFSPWISLLIAMALAGFVLYWLCHRAVAVTSSAACEQPA